MQQTLFPEERHDAGGKVNTKLPKDIKGDAVFAGEREQYRPLLRRWTGSELFPRRFLLFIGMNPSTATERSNDSTITREWGFCVREGYSAFAKCNVIDYRMTKPAELLKPGIVPQSDRNRAIILEQAAMADMVIVCWGGVNRVLKPFATSLVEDLRSAGIQPRCFGRTKDGHPKHPLYLARNTVLTPFFS